MKIYVKNVKVGTISSQSLTKGSVYRTLVRKVIIKNLCLINVYSVIVNVKNALGLTTLTVKIVTLLMCYTELFVVKNA